MDLGLEPRASQPIVEGFTDIGPMEPGDAFKCPQAAAQDTDQAMRTTMATVAMNEQVRDATNGPDVFSLPPPPFPDIGTLQKLRDCATGGNEITVPGQLDFNTFPVTHHKSWFILSSSNSTEKSIGY
jgi:hypothetical protein